MRGGEGAIPPPAPNINLRETVIRSKQYYPQDLPTTATYAKSIYAKDNDDGTSTVMFKNAS